MSSYKRRFYAKGRLSLREFLEFEAIWPVRPFENFLEDCRTHFGAKEVNA